MLFISKDIVDFYNPGNKKKEFNKLYQKLDEDKNGKISKSELAGFIKRMSSDEPWYYQLFLEFKETSVFFIINNSLQLFFD